MSLRGVIGAVGAVVGFIIGGPQGAKWGWMIGSTLGGIVDPQVIQGPRIGDIPAQQSQEGGPRPIVLGRSLPIPGCVIAEAEPRIETHTQSGKGGPKYKTQVVYRTYAIGVCEGPIAGFERIWRNGKKVYDITDDAFTVTELTQTLLAAFLPLFTVQTRNEKFLDNARFFLGSYTQDASPDLEAVFGAGSTAAHRGTAYMVMVDEDCTDVGGAIPQWTFQIAGTVPPVLTDPVPSGTLGTQSSATIGATTDQVSGTLYVVVGTGSQLVGATAAQIIAGQNAAGDPATASGSTAIAAASPTVAISGLSPSTTYTYSIVQVNDNGTSNIVSGSFTTAADPASYDPVVTFGGPGSSGSFTYHKPTSPPLTGLAVVVVGGGAGGLDGLIETYPTGSYPSRGGGGGGGRSVKTYTGAEIAALASSIDVTVGAGGASGAAGGTSSFGTDCVASGGSPSTTGGVNGAGGVQVTPTPSGSDNTGGAGSVTSSGSPSVNAGGGGGRGGAIASAGAGFIAKDGGAVTGPNPDIAGGTAGTYPNGAGGAGGTGLTIPGSPASTSDVSGGGGGGGGAHSGQVGGAGGYPGGGGGGGGNVHNSGTPGSGGAGANGIVVILQQFN